MADLTLEELAAKVEGLSGPDREVEALIVTTLCPSATVGEYIGYEDIVFHAEAIGIPNKEICPFYTASIDAAMTLVLDGAGVTISRYWIASKHGPVWSCEIGTGGTPSNPRRTFDSYDTDNAALAICAAALRARSNLSDVKGE